MNWVGLQVVEKNHRTDVFFVSAEETTAAAAAETTVGAEAAVVAQRKSSQVEESKIEPAEPVPDGNKLEEDGQPVEELADELHGHKPLVADGRLELCQLSKLLQCVRARDVRMIDNLVSKGVPHLLDYAHPTDNETALGLAASRNDDTLLAHLLHLGAYANAADVTGRSAAMRAAEFGHLQSMNVLAEAGIDMTLVDDEGKGTLS